MVEKLVKKWLEDTSEILDISGFNLKEWPEILVGKEDLIVKLYCSTNNQLTSLPNLPKCMELYCSGNQLTSLPNLPKCVTVICAHNQLTSLSNLPKCEWLSCFNNQLTSLPDLPECENLICSNNKLTFLPDLPNCSSLVCSNNKLTFLPDLPKCADYMDLNCTGNPKLFSALLSDWKKLWKLKSFLQSNYRKKGINKFLKILKLRLYLPRLTSLKQELIYSPNHPGEFFKLLRLGVWNNDMITK